MVLDRDPLILLVLSAIVHGIQSFIDELCGDGDAAEWKLRKPVASPLVWRELIEFGGRRLLIGGAAEFQEYVHGYYGLISQMPSCRMIALAKENVKLKQQVCFLLNARGRASDYSILTVMTG